MKYAAEEILPLPGCWSTNSVAPDAAKWRLYDSASSHTRLLPRGRSQGAADHEAVPAAGSAVFVVASAKPRLRDRNLRLDIRFAARTIPSSGPGPGWRSWDLRQLDDARQRAGHHPTCARRGVAGDVGR